MNRAKQNIWIVRLSRSGMAWLIVNERREKQIRIGDAINGKQAQAYRRAVYEAAKRNEKLGVGSAVAS